MEDAYFMNKALEHAKKALLVGEFPVGCVLVYNNEIISSGSRTGTYGAYENETDHAEMIALQNLANSKKNIDKHKISLFCTLEPCLMCFGAIILSGIRNINYAYEDIMGGATGCDLTKLPILYRTADILIKNGTLRHKSIELFKRYFANPKHTYWQNSILSEYTLKL